MAEFKNINLGKCIGPLKFGMERDEVKALMGDPDEVERYTDADEDDNQTETWHYDEVELSVSFDEMLDWKLVTIASSSTDHTLEGLGLVGLTKDMVMKKIAKLELGDFFEEEINDDDAVTQVLVSFDDVALNLWFEDDFLTEIIWSPLWEED